jgi:hypothetical protein
VSRHQAIFWCRCRGTKSYNTEISSLANHAPVLDSISVSPDITANTLHALKGGCSRCIVDDALKAGELGAGPRGAGQCAGKTMLGSNPPSWHSGEMVYLDLGVA